MCYAKPGPRCSGHAREELDVAIAAEAHASAAMDALRNVDDETTSPEERRALHRETGEAWRTAHQRLFEAERVYDTTPAGIAALKEQMAAREAEIGADAIDTDGVYSEAKRRLAAGQQKRRDQLEAYHQAESLIAQARGGTVEPEENEEEALAPVPECKCIEYSYKGTCSDLERRHENLRRQMVPTSAEASLALHNVRREFDQQAAHAKDLLAASGLDLGYEYHLFTIAGADSWKAAPEECKEAIRTLNGASGDLQRATDAFDGTPAGQALLARQAARLQEAMGYHSGAVASITGRAERAAEGRTNAVAAYAEKTDGKPVLVEAPGAEPPVMASVGGCECEDYRWTGLCRHTNAHLAAEEDQTVALAQALSKNKSFRQFSDAVDNLGQDAPKKRGLLARLRGR